MTWKHENDNAADAASFFAAAAESKYSSDATLYLVTMGHGYGNARFSSTCKLTGDRIQAGEVARKVIVWTKSGHRFEGYMSNRMLSEMRFSEVRATKAIGENGRPIDGFYCTWSKCRQDWHNIAMTAEIGTELTVISKNAPKKAWHRGKNGKWSRGYSEISQKALQSALKRGKYNLMFKIRTDR